jgi:hypothetical protein
MSITGPNDPRYLRRRARNRQAGCSAVVALDIVQLATASSVNGRYARRVIMLAAAACIAFAFANTQARADGAWCARDSLGCTNCGFHTFAQCQANVSGMGGSCERNPNRVASSDARGRKQRNN